MLSRGLIWAASITRPPSFKVTAFWLSCMDTAGTSTVTVHFDCRPLEADAVMVAVPLAFAFTKPLPLTSATEGLSDSHVTVLSVALAGAIAALN